MDVDWRVELILRVESEHSMSSAATKEASGGEFFRCRCGEKYKGDGSLKQGRRHRATEIAAALDEATASV